MSLAACGESGHPSTRLEITAVLPYDAPDGGVHHFDLVCDPPSGTVPDPGGLCAELAARPELVNPPAMAGTCAGGPGIPPAVEIRGVFEGRVVEITRLRSCDGPPARARIAERWYALLGITP